MADYDQYRVFVGGLSWEISDRDLESEFRRFGKVIEAKVMLDRATGRPRGFGFVTFADKRGMEEAIERLHGRELDGRVVSVTKAQPKAVNGDRGFSQRDGYDNDGPPRGGRGGGYGGQGGRSGGRDNCYKCGQPGHWARDCPMGDDGGGGRFSSRERYGGDSRDRYGGGGGPGYGGGGRYDRYGGRDRDRYSNRGYDRYDGGYDGRYSDRDGGHGSERYGSGGPARYDGRYRDRAGPYERPSGGGGRSNYDDRY